jgi:hypothetical protein
VLEKHPEGLRAEQIRTVLQLDRRAVPRPLADGLVSGALRKEGNKRATTYFAAAAPAAGSTPKRKAPAKSE